MNFQLKKWTRSTLPWLSFSFSILAALSDSAYSAGKGRKVCNHEKTGNVPWSYCYEKSQNADRSGNQANPANPTNNDILYYFHGAYGDEKEWWVIDSILKEFKKNPLGAPTVVGVSFGSIWLLAPRGGSERAGEQLETLVNIAIPKIETELNLDKGGRRMLVGASMGGFNAIEVALNYPKLFERVALLCPMLIELPLIATQAEVDDYIHKTHASRVLLQLARKTIKSLFKDDRYWNRANPFILAPSVFGSDSFSLLISCGRQDPFGFFLGSQNFARQAFLSGVSVQWLPVEGGHCSFEAPAIAKFFLNSYF